MTDEEGNVARVREYFALVERMADVEAVLRCWHPEGVFEEQPNALSPRGSTRDRAGLAESFARGQALLASQRYELGNIVAAGAQVVVELVWTGTVKIDVGPLRAGETLRARCAAVFELREGLIHRQRQYDCYEPRK